VPRPKNYNVISTKWVFRNKQNEGGVVVRNKARMVAQGFTQVEGLDFGETFAPAARLEAIRILLAYAFSHNIKLYQMDVKSAFLNGRISELVYVEQPLGFEDLKKPNHVYKLSKLSMVLSKFLGLGIRDLETFSFLKASKFMFTKSLEKTCLFFKFMLMILSLVLLIKVFMRSLVR
jgi:hypothetical protein